MKAKDITPGMEVAVYRSQYQRERTMPQRAVVIGVGTIYGSSYRKTFTLGIRNGGRPTHVGIATPNTYDDAWTPDFVPLSQVAGPYDAESVAKAERIEQSKANAARLAADKEAKRNRRASLLERAGLTGYHDGAYPHQIVLSLDEFEAILDKAGM